MKDYLTAKEKYERELRDKCFMAGLNERDTELCVDYFVRRLSHKEVAAKRENEVSAELSRNKKHKFKKLLKL